MSEKRTAFVASVKEREQQLRIAINSISGQVDLIHLVLNWYQEIPEWVKENPKIFPHLNPSNKNAHDSVWTYLNAENTVISVNKQDQYFFIFDDDFIYPADYVEKFIETINRYKKKAVVTAHGANILRPVESYFKCRSVYGYSDRLMGDIYVDMAGCGVTAFHSSTIRPILQNFPVPYCRDLWFSILCAKNKVPIISLTRPADWIKPLATPGESVYEVSQNNASLIHMKDRILKEAFLPLLFCDRDNDDYCLITDYSFDELLVNATLETLRNTSVCNKIIFADKTRSYGEDCLTQYVTPDELALGTQGSKVITQYRFIRGLKDEARVISADADLYFLKNPFDAFNKDFDIGVTTRPYPYQYPINAGVVMFRVNDCVRDFLDFIMGQVSKRTWEPLIEWQDRFGHQGNEWYIDQDIWCVAFENKSYIREKFNVRIADIGPRYNFCPHADGAHTNHGKDLLMEAYRNKSAHVLHLKSRLKELLIEGHLK